MQIANYSSVRNEFKYYCDQVTETDTPLVVTRKENNNIVMMTLDRYNELERQVRNAQHITKVVRAYNEVINNGGIEHNLIEVE